VNNDLLQKYRGLASWRRTCPVLSEGDLRFLFVGSGEEGTVVYGRKSADGAAFVMINSSSDPQTVAFTTDGFVPRNLGQLVGTGIGDIHNFEYGDGQVSARLGPLSAQLYCVDGADLTAPDAPAGLDARLEPGAEASLSWTANNGAAGYNVYASPLTGGGYVKLNDAPITDTNYFLPLTRHGVTYFVVTALDAAGNESGWSNEVSVTPPD
jgi:hypothetical protein